MDPQTQPQSTAVPFNGFNGFLRVHKPKLPFIQSAFRAAKTSQSLLK
jgi:hypothetical protein